MLVCVHVCDVCLRCMMYAVCVLCVCVYVGGWVGVDVVVSVREHTTREMRLVSLLPT